LELADGGVTLAQVVEQLDPHRLAQYAEPLSDEVDERVRKRVREWSLIRHAGTV
jgi:hypothetical protein